MSNAETMKLRGLHRLAGAVLVQAIEDIRCGSSKKRVEAMNWVENNVEDQFSFVFCCQMLERNPAEVRRFLQRQEIPAFRHSHACPQEDLAQSEMVCA